jgi:hypothetical protein
MLLSYCSRLMMRPASPLFRHLYKMSSSVIPSVMIPGPLAYILCKAASSNCEYL